MNLNPVCRRHRPSLLVRNRATTTLASSATAVLLHLRKGSPHRYFFKLYALDVTLELPSGATKAQLEQAMKGHILAEGRLMGKYQR